MGRSGGVLGGALGGCNAGRWQCRAGDGTGTGGHALADVLADEVKSINERIGLPEQVTVVVADCGEANAYYNPEDRTITMCNEYAQNLQEMWESNAE